MEFHQILVSASPGDAVTNAALETRALLRRIGGSDVYARYVHEDLKSEVHPLEEYERLASARRGGNVLLYHASIGEPQVLSFLLGRPERLVLVYHNIAPARYYQRLDPAFAELLTGGRVELAALRDRADLALAVSEYNGRELTELGYKDVRISPLVVDPGALARVGADAATSAELTGLLDGPLILFVGQLLPHKRPDLLMQAYHVLVTYLLPEAHLALIGSFPNHRYREILETYRRELNLARCHMPGRVSDPELAAWFRAATVFVTLSEHEGLCVPLLEAMSFDLPVVARQFAAVPETLDGAGLLLPPDDDPLLLAETLAEVLSDPSLRQALVDSGRRRIDSYDADASRVALLGHLADVA